MKRIKIVMTTLLVIAGLIALFAFTRRAVHKSVDMCTYYFSADHTHIGTGDPDRLVQSEVTATWKWTTVDQGDTFVNGDYLAAITFDEDKITKQEAIDGVWSYYVSLNPDSLPEDGLPVYMTVGGCTVSIIIHRKISN